MPAVVTGQPAQIALSRAILLPVAPSGKPQPMIDVFHLAGIDAGARDGVLDGMAAHHRAMGLVEAAAHRFGQAGARGGDDDGLFHGNSLCDAGANLAVTAVPAKPPWPADMRRDSAG